jgi:gamma-glutamyltranspeptidase / glutathione hydrolase
MGNMKGAVAAGHQATAEAGAAILAEGGNAVDACLAAAFASWVAESPLTGPGGGGFLLVHRAQDRKDRVLDFFVSMPGSGRRGRVAEMEAIDVDFDGSSSQVFLVGPASCAVPGTVAGLEAAHRAFSRMPWARLVEPAIELARNGVELTPQQAYLHAILDLILRHTAEGREIYGRERRLARGEKVLMPDLARTLEILAAGGARELYAGDLGREVVEHVQGNGGALTRQDLEEYRVIWRRPTRTAFEGHDFVSNPPPSSGGVLIAYALALLERLPAEGGPGSAEAVRALVEVMRETARARRGAFVGDLYRGGLARRLCSDENVRAAVARIEQGWPTEREQAGAPGTTHISVVDANGNAASLTASTGAGSGVVVPGTGIHMNNMLGEYDLNPGGSEARPGRRLTSMMAPSIVLRGAAPRLVIGSAGSIRLRGAILQLVVNVVRHGLPVEDAISAPRVHVDDGHVHCEGGADPGELDRLERLGYELIRWRRRNLYFGGAAAVEVREDGSLHAAGDPRRGGHGIVVG